MRSLSLLLVAAVVLAAATAGVSGASLAPVVSMPSLASGDAPVAAVAKKRRRGAQARKRNCDPNYRGRCLRRNVRDYDCAGGSGDGPRYVRGPFRVVGRDRFGLDSDGDGIACES